jgi:hypothetical protein
MFHHTLSTVSSNVLKCVVSHAYLLLLLKPYHVTLTEDSTHQSTPANCTPWQYQPNHILCLAVTHISDQIWTSTIPLQAWSGPEGPRKLRLPQFHDNRHTKVARLLALFTSHLSPPPPKKKYPRYLSRPSDAVRIKSNGKTHSNPRPSGLQRTASTNCATTYSRE